MTRAAPIPFGPFVLERRLAVGGSAEVFLARPKSGTRPAPRLVIKRLLPSGGGEHDFDALEREASLHRSVRHPNVVEMYGAGMVGEEPYLAMEWVDGVDLYRLIRRSEAEQRPLPVGLSVYVARCIAAALGAVHAATDERGRHLGIVHRDVTPSNVYLSVQGEVKLGDFGIARVSELAHGSMSGPGLKGKFGYLAPEHVAGEPFDHRADLFAVGVILGELLAGERIFPGAGHLAVLLSIRDGDITPLRRCFPRLPDGLPALLERVLDRNPSRRPASGEELARELARWEAPGAARALAEWVEWARDASRLAQKLEGKVRESVQRMQAARASSGSMAAVRPLSALSTVLRADGTRLEELTFAELVELLATGGLGPDDQVGLMGAEPRPVRELGELARHLLPSTTTTTARLLEPGVPDYQEDLATVGMRSLLVRLRRRQESGVLFVERRDGSTPRRKEIYLRAGRLHFVPASQREELLGEYLVKRKVLTREDLARALDRLGRCGGRLGDTLIALGLVDPIQVFRAIRDQGRDRVATLCTWTDGRAAFYRGKEPAHVEFPLELDLTSCLMAGVIYATGGRPAELLAGVTELGPGPRREQALSSETERGTAPATLLQVPRALEAPRRVEQLVAELREQAAPARPVSEAEAWAALVVAVDLGWAVGLPGT